MRLPPALLTFASLASAAALAEEPATAPPEPEPVRLVVTGTRTPRKTTEDPVGTEVFAARELQSRNVRDASRALEAEPGVQAERSFRGSSFQLRGLEAKYVRILQDAMPLVGQVNDVIDLRRFALEGLERIEVVRGAASALYGADALAGVVNFISRRPRRAFEASGFAQYGSLNASALGLYAGTRRGDWGATLSLNGFGQDSYDATPGDQDLSTNGDARRAGTAVLRGFYQPGPAVDAMAFVRLGRFDTRGVDLQPPRALWNRRVGETEYSGGATAAFRPDDATRLTAYAQASAFARTFWRQQRQGPGLDDQASLERLLRAELQADRSIRPGLSATLGAGGQSSRLESPRLAAGDAVADSAWLFGQAELSRTGWGELLAGGRVDFDRTYGVHVTPRVALRADLGGLSAGLALRASFGRGFRAPSLGERYLSFKNNAANYVVTGNPRLEPETSTAWQAGLEWAPPSAGASWLPSLRVTGHHTVLDGLIQAVDTSGANTVFEYRNYASGRIRGVEGALRLAHRRLVVDLGAAWLDARGTLDGAERPLPGRAGRQYTALFIARREESGTEWSMRAQRQSRRTSLDTAQSGFFSPLMLVDGKVTQRLWGAASGGAELSAFAAAENLLGEADLGFLSLPGRTFQGGVQGRY